MKKIIITIDNIDYIVPKERLKINTLQDIYGVIAELELEKI